MAFLFHAWAFHRLRICMVHEIAIMIIITPSKSLAYNHEPFFPERLLSFFKVCLLQMSSVLMFSWMQLLWQNNGARCHWRCSPKTWTNHILHLFIFWKLLAKHDLYIFFWVILTFDWNKASSIYQQEGLVCWYCLSVSCLRFKHHP